MLKSSTVLLTPPPRAPRAPRWVSEQETLTVQCQDLLVRCERLEAQKRALHKQVCALREEIDARPTSPILDAGAVQIEHLEQQLEFARTSARRFRTEAGALLERPR